MNKILLIDDDPIFVLLTRKIMESVDIAFVLDVFSDGELALDHIQSVKHDPDSCPDIIFLDLNMPVLDGWAFLEAYSTIQHQLGKTIRMYVLSSTISPSDIFGVTAYSFVTDFLIKPVGKAKMEEILLA